MPIDTPYRCIRCASWYPHRVDVCTRCWEGGCVVLWPRRVAADVDSVAEVTSAAELARAAWDETPLAAYRSLRVSPGTLVLVSGPPGAGKTTWAVRAIDSIRAPVTLWSAEMGTGPALAATLARLGVRRETFHVVGRASIDAVHAQVTRGRSAALAIDSVQAAELEPEDARHLLAVAPTLALIVAIAQVNKQGEVAGEMRWPHEADVVVRVEAMRWRATKSRYQPIDDVEGAVLDAHEEETDVATTG